MKHTPKYFILLLCIAFVSLFTQDANAQFFKAAPFVGVNASQLDGDKSAGFNKFGLNTGVTVGFNLRENLSLEFEFTYSQEGSRETIKTDSLDYMFGINLQYVSLPVVLKYYDWYDDNIDQYRVYASAGISNGILFNSSAVGSNYANTILDEFSRYNVSWLAGIGGHLTKNLAAEFRYVRSFNKLYFDPDPPRNVTNYLIGYYLHARLYYYF